MIRARTYREEIELRAARDTYRFWASQVARLTPSEYAEKQQALRTVQRLERLEAWRHDAK